MQQYVQIAIDGPAGAGKTSTARALARELGFLYLDTGALFRALAYFALPYADGLDGMSTDRLNAVILAYQANNPQVRRRDDGTMSMWLGGSCIDAMIRSPEVSEMASRVSTRPEVREYVLRVEREQAELGSIVAEGRDIGTHVFPDAALKVYLTADPETRAARRVAQAGTSGEHLDYAQVLDDLNKRDLRDSTRENAPLKPADGAVVLDNSNIGLDATVQRIVKMFQGLDVLGLAPRDDGVIRHVPALKGATELVADNDACVVLRVRPGHEEELVAMGCFSGHEAMFRVTKGTWPSYAVFYAHGEPVAWHPMNEDLPDGYHEMTLAIRHCVEVEYGIVTAPRDAKGLAPSEAEALRRLLRRLCNGMGRDGIPTPCAKDCACCPVEAVLCLAQKSGPAEE